MNIYLISFRYEYYCQGYEWTTETLLVKAVTFEDACRKIQADNFEYRNARSFVNKTIE